MEYKHKDGMRIDAIDIAKGIGIIFVVFCHVNFTPNILTMVYGFHMPLFFIISGLLFSKDKYARFELFLKRRLITLICPYVLFYIFCVISTFLLQIISEGFHIGLVKEHARYFIQMIVASGGSSAVINEPFWFVLSLFAVEILYYFIVKIKRKSIIAITCAVLSFVGWFLQSDLILIPNEYIPWNLDSSLFAIGFYAFGNLMGDKIKIGINYLNKRGCKNWLCIGIFSLCILIYIPITVLNGKISIGSKILNNGFLLYISGIVGTIAVIAISIMLSKNRFLRFCGRNSFYIMSVHCLIRNAPLIIIYKILGLEPYDRYDLVDSLVPFVIVLSLSVVLVLMYSMLKIKCIHICNERRKKGEYYEKSVIAKN